MHIPYHFTVILLIIIRLQAQVLSGEKSHVTQLCSVGDKIAVGYADGNIHVYDLTNGEMCCVFSGHKSPVTALCFDSLGHKLFSGSKVFKDFLSNNCFVSFYFKSVLYRTPK